LPTMARKRLRTAQGTMPNVEARPFALINGWKVIAVFPCPEGPGFCPARVILAKRDDQYVTAIHCEENEEWNWGHYFDAEEYRRACRDFVDRCLKYI
jgi:predicted secreted protein